MVTSLRLEASSTGHDLFAVATPPVKEIFGYLDVQSAIDPRHAQNPVPR